MIAKWALTRMDVSITNKSEEGGTPIRTSLGNKFGEKKLTNKKVS